MADTIEQNQAPRHQIPTERFRTPASSEGQQEEFRETKKDVILRLYRAGMQNVAEISQSAQTTPSYVAAVLRAQGYLTGYYDLYTNTGEPMNVYSKQFRGQLGFRNVEVARSSVERLERSYLEFENTRDRAGQHHCLLTALTLFDRARWSGKSTEAEIFRAWLVSRLSLPGARS